MHREADATGTRVAAQALLRLLKNNSWVHRRIETITVLDESSIRRETSLNYTLPREPSAAYKLIPLVAVSKQSEILRVDVQDEKGSALPTLNRVLTNRLTAASLIELVLERLHTETRTARPTRALAATIARAVLRPTEAGGLNEALAVATGRTADGADIYDELYPDPLVAAIVRHDEEFLDLLGLFAVCRPLIVRMPAQTGQRLIKVGFDENLRRSERGILTRLSVTVGLRSPTLLVVEPNLGDAVEYHLQVLAPDGVQILRVRAPGGPPRALLLATPTNESVTFPMQNEPSTSVNNTYHLFGDPPPTPLLGALAVRLQAEPSNAAVSTFVCAVTTFLLWANALGADQAIERVEAVAALLLIVPAVGSAYVLRTENPMVASLITGMRLLVTSAALFAVLAVTALVVLPNTPGTPPAPTPELKLILVLCAVCATLAAAVALLVWRVSSRRSRRGAERRRPSLSGG